MLLTRESRIERLGLIALYAMIAVLVGCHLYLTFSNSLIHGDDSPVHLVWLEDYARLLQQRQWLPRWAPWEFGGLGSPIFYLYPQLPYLIGGIASLLSIANTPNSLFHFVQFVTLLGSYWSCYSVLRRLGFESSSSAIASTLYALAAYRFVDIFIRSALGEHLAFVFIPLVFYFVNLLADDGKDVRRIATYLALSFSALLLSNIPTAVCTAIASLPLISNGINRRNLRRYAIALVIGGALTFLLTSTLTLPALVVRDLTQKNLLVTLTSHHALLEIFDPTHRRIGIQPAVIFTILIGIVLLLLQNKARWSIWGYSVLMSIALQIPFLTDWLWSSGTLSLIQFSFRFTTVLTFGIAVLIAQGLGSDRRRSHLLIVIVSLGFSMMLYVAYLKNTVTSPSESRVTETRESGPEHATIYTLPDSAAVRQLSKEWSRLPFLVGKDSTIQQTAPSYERRSIKLQYEINSPQEANIHQFYWPYWAATIDGSMKLEIEPDSNGIIKTVLPAGSHQLELRMRRARSEDIADVLTLIGIAGVIGLWIGGGKKKKSKDSI
jgi:hypothetical protein